MFKWISENLMWIVSTILVPLIVWFASQRHFQQKELKSKELQNDSSQSGVVAQNLDLYQRMLDDISDKLFKAHEKVSELEKQIEIIKEQYTKLKEEYTKLKEKYGTS